MNCSTTPENNVTVQSPSEQERIYGIWNQSNTTYPDTTYVISDNSIIMTYDDQYLRSVIQINSFQNSINKKRTSKDKFPNGYRIRGVFIETNEPNRSVGDTYDRTWYISTDNQSIIRSDYVDDAIWTKE